MIDEEKRQLKGWKRQLPLLPMIQENQSVCEKTTGHELIVKKESIYCLHCNAIWIYL